jgi:hypothetical protein
VKTIYVAGASKEVDMVSGYMRKLEAGGYKISEDWTKSVIANREANKPDTAMSLSEMTKFAVADRAGVLSADMFWLIIPTNLSIGCWVELGMAIAHAMPSIISGAWQGKIFCTLADKIVDTHDEALDLLLRGNHD